MNNSNSASSKIMLWHKMTNIKNMRNLKNMTITKNQVKQLKMQNRPFTSFENTEKNPM